MKHATSAPAERLTGPLDFVAAGNDLDPDASLQPTRRSVDSDHIETSRSKPQLHRPMCWEPPRGVARAAGGLLGVVGGEAWRGSRGGFDGSGPVSAALVDLCRAYVADPSRAPVEVAEQHAGAPGPAWLLPVAFVRREVDSREREICELARAADLPSPLLPACIAYVELAANLFGAEEAGDAIRVARQACRWAAAPLSDPTAPRLLGIGLIDGLVASAWALNQDGNLASVIPLLVESGEVPVAPWVAAAAAGPLGVRDGCTAIPVQWLRWLPRNQRRLCQSLARELVDARQRDVPEEPQAATG